MRFILLASVWVGLSGSMLSLQAQPVLWWDMQQLQPSGIVSSLQVSSLVQGNNFGNTAFYTTLSASQNYPGASGANNAGVAARTGTLQTGASGSAYVGVTLTPPGGFRLRILSIGFGSRSTASGPTRWALFTSADQYTNPVASATLQANSTWSWQQSPSLSILSVQPIELRIYGYEGTGTTAINVTNWRMDDLKIYYQIDAITMPVSWLYFRYEVNQAAVLLQWATAAEMYNKEFRVERSIDGVRYTWIGTVPAASGPVTSQITRRYSFLDTASLHSRVCYRIRQIDEDGTGSYSSVIYVAPPEERLTPAWRKVQFDGLLIKAVVETSSAIRCVQLYNRAGQLVKLQPFVTTVRNATGQQAFTLYAPALPAGIYYLVAVCLSGRSCSYPLIVH